jgi:maltose alpha-D-glucosyltransferase/alpha-amylase
MRAGSELPSTEGVVRARGTRALAEADLDAELDSRRLGVEQSNTSLMLGRTAILKVYRQLRPGIHPELEIGRFLTDVAGFERTPALLGGLERIAADGTPWALAAAHAVVENQGDGWARLVGDLEREFEEYLLGADGELELAERHALNLALIATLGQRSAEMHRAFCHPTDDPAFTAEPVTAADLAAWRDAAAGRAEQACAALERVRDQLDGDDRLAAERILTRAADLATEIERAANVAPGGVKTRTHGDYHLGQVLVARNDFYIIDFEGEPLAGLEQRRRKTSALRDVAGMLRSLDYAATAAARSVTDHDESRTDAVRTHAVEWRDEAQRVFMASYREALGDCPVWPADGATAVAVLRLFSLEKALYEVGYEAANRPAWLRVPLEGVLGLLPPEDRQAEEPT